MQLYEQQVAQGNLYKQPKDVIKFDSVTIYTKVNEGLFAHYMEADNASSQGHPDIPEIGVYKPPLDLSKLTIAKAMSEADGDSVMKASQDDSQFDPPPFVASHHQDAIQNLVQFTEKA